MKLPIAPMLAKLTPAGSQPRLTGHAFEIKWDGHRLVAHRHESGVTLYARSGRVVTSEHPDVARELLQLPTGTVLDGEIVVVRDGRSNLQALANHRSLTRAQREERLRYMAFDVLELDGVDRQLTPYADRKELLQDLVARHPGSHLRYGSYSTDQAATWRLVEEHQLEGMIAKPLQGRYRQGERASWLKIKLNQRGTFAVIGFTYGDGKRAGTVGALVLGELRDGQLVPAGRCGTGFDEPTLDALMARFRPIAADTPALEPALARRFQLANRGERVTWLTAPVVATIEYAERSDDGTPRFAAFKGLVDR